MLEEVISSTREPPQGILEAGIRVAFEGAEKELQALHAAGYSWALVCCRFRPEDACEVLQASYLAVLEGRARFDGRSSFKTWLFGVIRRTAAGHRRRALLNILRLARVRHQAAPAARDPSSPEEAARTQQYRAQVHAAFALLPARQREVLDLVFYHDLTVEEAALVMRLSAGSARQHYQRGKERLRSLLERSERP